MYTATLNLINSLRTLNANTGTRQHWLR